MKEVNHKVTVAYKCDTCKEEFETKEKCEKHESLHKQPKGTVEHCTNCNRPMFEGYVTIDGKKFCCNYCHTAYINSDYWNGGTFF
jgi:peptide subunit release factor 1 (eRF1)